MSTPTSSSSTPPLSPHCPRCGRAIPAAAVLGVCPHCLLAAGLASEPAASTETAPAPTLDELAPDFPQLELLELLGRGGMGAVYKARQRSLDRLVALKLLRPGLDADSSFAERFTREARALAQLNHPGIVTLYEFGRTPSGRFFILMEFVDGLNLRQLLAAGRLAPREALAIIPPLCDALQYAHDRGFVHRDIKPENILVDRLGRVKVADFGLAKLAGPASATTVSATKISATTSPESSSTADPAFGLTEAGNVMGTPQYMAPEQRERPDAVDHRADIYALGVVLYQMLTGELPDIKQLQPPSRRVQLDVRLDEIVLRALETEPSRRYQHASALKTQVETIATPSPAAAVATAPARPIVRRTFRLLVTLFSLLYALHLAWISHSADDLPKVVASHFGMDSQADGFMGKTGYLVFICAFPLALGLFLQTMARLSLRLPARFINVPNRAQWLTPERRPELAALLKNWFTALSCGLVILFAQLHTLTLLANRLHPPRLPDVALFVLLGFPFGLMLWTIGLLMRLAEPLAVARQHTRRTFALAVASAALLGFFSAPLIVAWNKPHEQNPPAPTTPVPPIAAQFIEITAPLSNDEIKTLLAAFPNAPSAAQAQIAQQAEAWLQIIDDRRYAQSWSESSPLFQQAVNETQWAQTLNSVRASLGSRLSRQLRASQYLEQLPNTPGGPHIVLQFATRFESKPAAIETVTFTRNDDGIWRASGYFIK